MRQEHLSIERVDPALSAEEFFSRYVSKRRPVIITGLIDDPSFKVGIWSDLSYLSQKAGDVQVMVEPIHPAANQYGTDVERISVTFGDFLDSLRSNEGPHPYLTTQYSEEEPDAETFFPPPTNALKDDFPVVPRIMGNLFLQQVNLWLGKSKDGSSSGLHHDFHDNLYCLLRGRKRFVLFPPSEIENLYPYGTLEALHPNGLISYADIPVRADGLSKRAACRARVRALEQQIDTLRERTKGKGKRQSKELRALMDAHDEALDELAMLALDEQDGDDEVDDFDALMAGLDDVDAELAVGPSKTRPRGDVEQGDEEDEEQEWEEWHGIGHSDDKREGSGKDDDDDDDDGSDEDDEDDADVCEEQAEPSEPPSFSRIPTAHLHQFFDIPTTAALPLDFSPSEFPRLRKAAAPHVIELSAGEMLYLPASWWHEVTSTSAGDARGQPPSQAGHGDVHMAFNYWFYPPDALDDFDAPYEDALVWDYLRSKSRGEEPKVEKVASEKAKTGKRARKEGDSEVAKKARR
ncbi:cupin-like domain-containing protein [Daedaleopsis nitida]|nr:cupin-like domain-containing protein [Daedaleopsis nitida]